MGIFKIYQKKTVSLSALQTRFRRYGESGITTVSLGRAKESNKMEASAAPWLCMVVLNHSHD